MKKAEARKMAEKLVSDCLMLNTNNFRNYDQFKDKHYQIATNLILRVYKSGVKEGKKSNQHYKAIVENVIG